MTGAGGEPFPCPARVPSGILAAWGLAPSPLCANQIPHHRASPLPFGLAAPNAAAGTRFSVQDQNEFWCADFAKWVWGHAGVRSDLGTLDPGAASFCTWALEHGQRPWFGSDAPAVGDAVVFYPPWDSAPTGSWADHVGIVVGVNSNGTVDLVNGDFGGDGTPITVEQNNDISIASWASEVWNSGEKWVFVSRRGQRSATTFAGYLVLYRIAVVPARRRRACYSRGISKQRDVILVHGVAFRLRRGPGHLA
jgi:hypothetical protein